MTGFGLLGAVFMAMLSAAYLKEIPGKPQLAKLQKALNSEFGPYLDPDQPLEVKVVPPKRRGERMSLAVRCVLRSDLRRSQKVVVGRFLRQMGEQALRHPAWRGRVATVAVTHGADPKLERIVREDELLEFPVGHNRAARLPSKG